MPTPSVAVFDLGKVLVDFDYRIAARRIAARGKMTMAEIGQFIAQSPLFLQYESGAVTTQQFFEEIRRVSGFSGSLPEFGECFADIFTAIEPMVQIHTALRQQGLRCYAFSNTNELAAEHIKRTFPFYANFDGRVLSFEHGVMKPDARIYEVLEEMAGRRGADIVYLDDRPENVAAGAARGWQAILQESPDKSRAALQKLGVLNHAS
jgi:HAD superfamily hydrolase (TIGR01509 family)